jgi:1-aminocyclopropane-1-carboxylate deaminase
MVPIEEINATFLKEKEISLWLKREDKLHHQISGNKFRKLKYNLAEAEKKGIKTLLTFGGAYSNHIYATAAAGKEYGFNTIGIIRGEEHLPLNPTLKFAREQGMLLKYLNREKYRMINSFEIITALKKEFGDFYQIPEGGSNSLALRGCLEIWEDLKENYHYLCVPVGTGGTMAGLIAGNTQRTKVLGFPALKGGQFLEKEIEHLLQAYAHDYNEDLKNNLWQIIPHYHFNGYAKHNQTLINFINDFKSEHGILLDPIYTGKMIYGIMDLISKNYFKPDSKIIVLHTGGLQAIDGFNQRFGEIIKIND